MSTNEIFELLKAILKKYESTLHLVHNTNDNYYLHTPSNEKNAKGEFFAAVQTKKSYVAFHLMPVYYYPELLNGISPELKKHMQGKSCFNFKEADSKLFAELKKLTSACYGQYSTSGKI